MKLTGHIGHDDHGNIISFLENEAGQMMEIGTEQINWQAFDAPAKAKKDAAEKIRHNTANALADVAFMFRDRNISEDLT